MTEDELQHMQRALHDVCGAVLRMQIDMQSKADLRDQFAMAALTSMLSPVQEITSSTPIKAAELAYQFADAMMEARK